jgi:hypothetical protein
MNSWTRSVEEAETQRASHSAPAPSASRLTGTLIGFLDTPKGRIFTSRAEETTSEAESRELPRTKLGGPGRIDAGLIRKAFGIIESTDQDDPCEIAINLNSLLGCAMDMWDNAARSAEPYQDVLASLESALRQAVRVAHITPGQMNAVREAINYLSQSHLARANAQVVRERFVREGFGPLSFAGQSEGDGIGDAR